MKLDKFKIEMAMADACLNSYDVCEKVDLNYPTFSKAKRGCAIKPATAGKIAKALGVSVQELLAD